MGDPFNKKYLTLKTLGFAPNDPFIGALQTEFQAFSRQMFQQVATGLFLPAHLIVESDSNFSASAAATASHWQEKFDVDNLAALAEKLDAERRALRQEELRAWSRNINRLQCPRCGRKPTITGSDGPDTMHLCNSTMAALRRQFADQAPEVAEHFGADHLGSLALVPFPCIPRAPLQ